MTRQQQRRRNHLAAPFHLHHEEADEVGERHLGKHINQLEGEFAAGDAAQNLAEEQQPEGPHRHVLQVLGERRALFDAARQRERHGHSNHEHERRLDHVPKHAAFPIHVIELMRNHAPGGMIFQRREAEAARRQHHHDESAVGVQRDEALRNRCTGGPRWWFYRYG